MLADFRIEQHTLMYYHCDGRYIVYTFGVDAGVFNRDVTVYLHIILCQQTSHTYTVYARS